MNGKNHDQFRTWLESEETLDTATEAALQAHLETCADCRTYAEMIAQLQQGTWNPFPPEPLTQARTQKIVQQIRPQLRRNTMIQKSGFFKLSSALGLIGLVVMVGLFALTISQFNQTAVSPAASEEPTAAPVSHIGYDGWETNVAFQFPANWTIASFDTDSSSIITFATPLDETAASCEPYMREGAAAWIIPHDETMPLTPLEFLTQFAESDEMIPLEGPQTLSVNDRVAAYTLAEIPCEAPFNQLTIMTAETSSHYVLFGLRHAADEASTARNELQAMIASAENVDYAGWQPWQPEGFFYTIMTPQDWHVFDALKSLELTTSSQPMWSSFAEPNQPANPLRMNIFHNLNSQVGDTPQAVVEKHIAQMEAELTMQQVKPPTAHPFVPGLVTAVYTTEDSALFFGAVAYPRDTVSLDPIGASAVVPLDQLDSFGVTFERILRSLNGYYRALEGIEIRETIRGNDYIPTPTSFPPTLLPPGLATPTPTPYDFSTADPSWTATPFRPTAVPSNPLFATPTPTPFEFPTVDLNATSTPIPTTVPSEPLFLTPTPIDISVPGWTPTPIPNPTEP